MADETFTQDQVNEAIAAERTKWESEVLKPVQDQVKELEQYKPKDKTDAEKELEQKQQELWQKEMNLELKSSNLEDFADFIHAQNMDDLKQNIKKLDEILKAKQLDSNNFVPENHKQQSAYCVFRLIRTPKPDVSGQQTGNIRTLVE